VVLVEVTPAGDQLVERRRAQRTQALRALLGQLDRTDRDAVRDALPALDRLVELALTAPSPSTGAVA